MTFKILRITWVKCQSRLRSVLLRKEKNVLKYLFIRFEKRDFYLSIKSTEQIIECSISCIRFHRLNLINNIHAIENFKFAHRNQTENGELKKNQKK